MRIDVRYAGRDIKIKRLANAVLKEICNEDEAKTTLVCLNEYIDVLFLGDLSRSGKPSSELIYFLDFNKDKIGKVYIFSTSPNGKSPYTYIKEKCESLGIKCEDENYYCLCSSAFKNKGRPNDEDVKGLKEFTRLIVDRERKI